MYRDEMSSPNHIIKAWKRCEIPGSKPLILISVFFILFLIISLCLLVFLTVSLFQALFTLEYKDCFSTLNRTFLCAVTLGVAGRQYSVGVENILHCKICILSGKPTFSINIAYNSHGYGFFITVHKITVTVSVFLFS